MESDVQVVWWALLLGGVCGGIARLALQGAFELPYGYRDAVTGRWVVVPGFAGDLLLGPAAAFILGGASAATYDFQTAYDARGFWGPFIASIPAGLASAQVLQGLARERLDALAEELLLRAKEVSS